MRLLNIHDCHIELIFTLCGKFSVGDCMSCIMLKVRRANSASEFVRVTLIVNEIAEQANPITPV